MARVRFTLVALGLVACGSNGSAPAADAGHDATGRVDTGVKHGFDATVSDARLTLGDGGSGGDAQSGFGCSGDLRSVVDEHGNVVSTCPDDQGCSSGACIAACAAAAASHGSLGCDFWISTPVTYDVEGGQKQPCFGMFLANAWPSAANLTVSLDGTTYDPTVFGAIPSQTAPPAQWPALTAQGVPVDGVAVLYLSGAPGVGFVEDPTDILSCPQMTATGNATEPVWSMVDGGATGMSHAFHVTSTVSAYDIFPFGGANSHFPAAELLYPSSAWGTNYVVISTPDGTDPSTPIRFLDIVAYEDDTSVTFSPAASLSGGGGLAAVSANASTTFTLNAGQYAHWETSPPTTGGFSGSIVLATNPVSVTAGTELFRLQPFSEPGGDATHAQIATTTALGHDYAVSPYVTRRADLLEESISYRLVGIVAGTVLTFDPPVPGAPAMTSVSEVSDFQVTGAFRVTSQDKNHPFSIAQVMSSGNLNYGVDGGTFRIDCATIQYLTAAKACGDEDFVPLIPPAQFLSKYVFFTDPTYSTTSIDLVRTKGSSGFQDVTVDCLGTIQGWAPIGASGLYEYARADLLRGVVPGTLPDGGACTNGRHVASSAAPFGLLVYGLDSYSSYGYPAGGNASVLSGVVVKPPQ